MGGWVQLGQAFRWVGCSWSATIPLPFSICLKACSNWQLRPKSVSMSGRPCVSLNRKKFEAVIIDLGLTEADQVLGQVRLSPSNRTAVTFAITDAGKPAKAEIQPNFMIEKPTLRGFGGANPESGVRIDRARAAPFLSLSHGTFSNPRDQSRRSQLPPGQYQRGRPGHHWIARPEARDTGSGSLHAARPVSFISRLRPKFAGATKTDAPGCVR